MPHLAPYSINPSVIQAQISEFDRVEAAIEADVTELYKKLKPGSELNSKKIMILRQIQHLKAIGCTHTELQEAAIDMRAELAATARRIQGVDQQFKTEQQAMDNSLQKNDGHGSKYPDLMPAIAVLGGAALGEDLGGLIGEKMAYRAVEKAAQTLGRAEESAAGAKKVYEMWKQCVQNDTQLIDDVVQGKRNWNLQDAKNGLSAAEGFVETNKARFKEELKNVAQAKQNALDAVKKAHGPQRGPRILGTLVGGAVGFGISCILTPSEAH